MTTQIHKQKDRFDAISDRIIEKLENLDKTKAQTIIDGAKEFDEAGFEKHKICNELVKRLAKVADESYVRKVLKNYPQYKEQYRVDNASKRNSSRNSPAKPESPTIEVPGDKVKVQPTITERKIHASLAPLLESVQVDNSSRSGSGSASVADPDPQRSESQTNQSNKSMREQPQPKEAPGRHNIDPQEYDLDHLHEYDKDLLARIVICIDKDLEDMSKLVVRKSHEVEELNKQLESVKPFVELFSHLSFEARESWLQFMKNALEREKGLRK